MRKNWVPLTVLAVFAATSSFVTAEDAHKKNAQDHSKGMVASNEIVGAEIRNAGQEQISAVNDIVLNDKGEIVYIIAGTGGVAGVFESEVAIPAKAVTCESRMNDGERVHFLTVPMTQEKLNQAPKLEADNYAELLNQSWINQNNKYFSTAGQEQAATQANLMFASSLNDLAIKTSDGKDYGHIEDLVISGADHKVKYVVLGSGGALTVGENYVAVPFDAVTFNRDQDQQWQASVKKTKEDLERMPKVTAPDYLELNKHDVHKATKSPAAAR